MDLRNIGGTPGGARLFFFGVGMTVVGAYLLLQQVVVTGGYWHFGWLGGSGRSFGLTLIPLLIGVGILFYDGRSFAGRCLTGLGALIIVAGIIVNIDVQIRQTSLFNLVVMLVLLVGGVGLVVRAVLPMESKRAWLATSPSPPPTGSTRSCSRAGTGRRRRSGRARANGPHTVPPSSTIRLWHKT